MAKRSQEQLDFKPLLYFNIETVSAVRAIDSILDEAADEGIIDGLTFGRGDYTESLGLSRSEVDVQQVTDTVMEVCRKTTERGLNFCVGGSVSSKSVGVLQGLAKEGALAFETRKISVNFSDVGDDEKLLKKSIESALKFELVWLETKRDRYLLIADEDKKRIGELESRLQVS
jgi:2-keto-3-deoxy-L-rhamnonate aldolase RhmA